MGFWDRIRGRGDGGPREAGGGPRRATGSLRVIDEKLARLRRGEEPSDADLRACGEAFDHYYDVLTHRNQTSDTTRFAEEDRVTFYVEAVKLTALGHPEYNAFPAAAEIRAGVLPSLKRRLMGSFDPWTFLCAISPAVLAGEVDLAVRLYQQIQTDPFLARLALEWVRESIIGYPGVNDVDAVRSFLGAVGERLVPSAARPLPPPHRWALATAVYPSYAIDRCDSLGAARLAATCRMEILRDWDIVDRPTAVEMLSWLFIAGHRALLANDLEAIAAGRGRMSESRRAFVSSNSEALRRHGIVAWDLCRLVATARAAHKAGYLSEGETWEWVFRAARKLRATYTSWREMGDDYVLGSLYFDPSLPPDNYHASSVSWRKSDPDSPWQNIPWEIAPDDLTVRAGIEMVPASPRLTARRAPRGRIQKGTLHRFDSVTELLAFCRERYRTGRVDCSSETGEFLLCVDLPGREPFESLIVHFDGEGLYAVLLPEP